MITPIKFNFHPMGIDKGDHVVEKSDRGMKRKYLRGIASGVVEDGHGEKMTANCIKSFGEQATGGDVLLYPDIHGIRGTEDIGILVDHDIDTRGNWIIENRLYDEGDDIDAASIEKACKLWKQMKGLPPYTKPKQKGFSVEGYIPEDSGIVEMSDDGRRVIDNVILDGVVVVPRPAYQDSIAHAVYKALDEPAPWMHHKDLANAAKELGGYFDGRYGVDDMLHKSIHEVMLSNLAEVEKRDRIDTIFDLHKDVMIEMVMKSKSLFNKGDSDQSLPNVYGSGDKTEVLFKSLLDNVVKLKDSLRGGQ